MGRINWARVVGGGLLSGIVANVLEMAYGFVMRSQWEEFMKGKQMPVQAMAAHFLWSFVVGIAAIWLYAAIRPRYGPGPATAARAAFAVWLFVHATFARATATLQTFFGGRLDIDYWNGCSRWVLTGARSRDFF